MARSGQTPTHPKKFSGCCWECGSGFGVSPVRVKTPESLDPVESKPSRKLRLAAKWAEDWRRELKLPVISSILSSGSIGAGYRAETGSVLRTGAGKGSDEGGGVGRLAGEFAEEEEEERLEFLRDPPPMGMLRRAPPLVQ